ncbi:hypothetical protein HNI00_00885 [Thermoleptolyngbya oregonensis NK1-22]|uniref:Uncharacterized protein n=1 Tax=Thermoleptolyngbya oregonensis NK1-22 TaxID=2547457 RepID=A0AA97B970_9CYAN|nr:hypothetical protein [Thermoleptolyngbya oregonensis]WOB41890.1 hypothetical protein HNI00_00885 [Thermoleptolyngbya oregonensis NK1-22]
MCLALDWVEFILRVYDRSRDVFPLGDRPFAWLVWSAPSFADHLERFCLERFCLGRFCDRANRRHPGAAALARSA